MSIEAIQQRFPNLEFEPSEFAERMYMSYVQVSDNITLCVEMGGNPDNPPLLLIMGLGAQLLFWPQTFVDKLIEAGYFVIRFDNRDIGLSTKIKRGTLPKVNQTKMMIRLSFGLSNRSAPVPYNLFDMAADTAALIDQLDIAPTHVIGASMGGMIGQILAAKYPHTVKKLGLLFTSNNQPFLPPPKPKQFYTLLKAPRSLKKEDVINHSVWFISNIGSTRYLNKPLIRKTANMLYERSFHPAGVVQQFNAILATGSLKRIDKRISHPTLVIHGSEDGLIPPANGRAVAKAIKHSEFKLIKGMAHDLPEQLQPQIIEEFDRFFRN